MARASTGPLDDEADGDGLEHRVLGARLREERQRRSLTLRELARRVNVSASLISQIENGRVRPSVSTLMALVTELELSLDNLFSALPADERQPSGEEEAPVPTPESPAPMPSLDVSALLPIAAATAWSLGSAAQPAMLGGVWSALGVQRPGSRAYLELESGVRWERLTPHSVPGMEFLHVRYEVGASSTAAGKHTRHQGIEFGYVTSGTLHITVGFDEVVCGPGSSVMFDAATPHRLENRGNVAAEAVWLIIGRQSIPTSAAPDAPK